MISIVNAALVLQASAAAIAAPAFSVGETFEYSGKWSLFPVGKASLRVLAMDTVRGERAWHFAMNFDVSAAGFHNSTQLSSLTSSADFTSRRFVKVIGENEKDKNDKSDKVRRETFEIFPDSGYFRRNAATKTLPTSREPLDDVAFLYYVRSMPLTLGQTYNLNRYFRVEHNPLVVKVGTKRDKMELPDGSKVDCFVLSPILDEKGGMFDKSHRARIWITDDARRIPVQIESTYFFGKVTLKLNKITPGSAG